MVNSFDEEMRSRVDTMSQLLANAETSIQSAMSGTVTVGSSRQVEVECTGQGVLTSVRISPDFAKKTSTEDLSTGIVGALRDAQEAAERQRQDRLEGLATSPQELGNRINQATEVLLGQLNDIRNNLARLTSDL